MHAQGLEDQLLAEVVRRERPDLEEARDRLVVSIAGDKRQLKELEDRILKLLKACVRPWVPMQPRACWLAGAGAASRLFLPLQQQELLLFFFRAVWPNHNIQHLLLQQLCFHNCAVGSLHLLTNAASG